MDVIMVMGSIPEERRKTSMPTIHELARILLAAFIFASVPASAQTYPAKPIRLIVPFAPATGIDVLARMIGEPLSKRLGQPVVVENKPGASGNLGSDLVAKSPPDGYTLMLTSNTFTMTPALYKSLPYDPMSDFSPIGLIGSGNLALVAHPSLEASTVRDLIVLARKEPGKLRYASPGNGTPQHLAMEAFKQMAGIDLAHVPYKGTVEAVTDVMAGQVPLMIMPMATAVGLAIAGKVLILGVSGDKRSALAPIYPTFREAGAPQNFDFDVWYAVLAPARIPREIAGRLQREIEAVMAQPDVRDALTKQGLTPAFGNPDELAARIKTDIQRWRNVAATAKITAD